MELLKVKNLIGKIDTEVISIVGDKDRLLGSAASLLNITSNHFTFCKEKNLPALNNIFDCVIVAPRNVDFDLKPENTYILVDNPRLVFIRIMKLVYPNGVYPKIIKGKMLL